MAGTLNLDKGNVYSGNCITCDHTRTCLFLDAVQTGRKVCPLKDKAKVPKVIKPVEPMVEETSKGAPEGTIRVSLVEGIIENVEKNDKFVSVTVMGKKFTVHMEEDLHQYLRIKDDATVAQDAKVFYKDVPVFDQNMNELSMTRMKIYKLTLGAKNCSATRAGHVTVLCDDYGLCYQSGKIKSNNKCGYKGWKDEYKGPTQPLSDVAVAKREAKCAAEITPPEEGK